MTKIASNSWIYSTYGVGSNNSQCPKKSVIIGYGCTVRGSYSDSQLVKEDDVKFMTELPYSVEGVVGQFYLTDLQSSELHQDSYSTLGPYIKIISSEYPNIIGEITNISVVSVWFTDDYGDQYSADYYVSNSDYTTNSDEGFLGIYPQNIVLEDLMGGSPSEIIDTFESGEVTLKFDFKLTCEGYYTVESDIEISSSIIQRFI